VPKGHKRHLEITGLLSSRGRNLERPGILSAMACFRHLPNPNRLGLLAMGSSRTVDLAA